MLNRLISNRGNMYGFLSRIYREEVDPELLDQIAKMDLCKKVESPEISEGYQTLHDYLNHQTEKTHFDLATDFASIFLVAGEKNDCAYPYESIYTSPLRLVMQDARDQVLKSYRENGLDRSPEVNEPEDHIAFELEFMSYLCHRIIQALKSEDKDLALRLLNKQKSFLEEHLAKWVPDFCKDIERIAEEDFYKAMAKITNGYLHLERGLIRDLIDTIKAG
jgi:TorA maturation chaperone TorD